MALNSLKMFVYGTLKRAEPSHFFLKECGCRFVTKAVSLDKYPLIIATQYNVPFLLNDKGTGNRIEGEVFDMDQSFLQEMDDFELCPGLYERDIISVVVDGGDTPTIIDCYCYLLNTFPPCLLTLPLISNYSNSMTTLKYRSSEGRLLSGDYWQELEQECK